MERFLRPPPWMNFSDIEQIDLAERWRRWREIMELYSRLNTAESAEKEQCDAFRYINGQDGRDIYNTMAFTVHEVDKIDILFAKFNKSWKDVHSILEYNEKTRQPISICYRVEAHCEEL
jgi:seryl-tRNA synthetase